MQKARGRAGEASPPSPSRTPHALGLASLHGHLQPGNLVPLPPWAGCLAAAAGLCVCSAEGQMLS